MTDDEIKTFTQDQVNQIVESRLMRERDKFKEITALNETLKGKITAIDTENLIKEAGLAPEWSQKLNGKTLDEVKAEVESIKLLVEKSKPAPEPIGSDTNPANTKPTIFTRQSIKNMTPQAINENWESIQKALKSGI
jgi:hypothetical protein